MENITPSFYVLTVSDQVPASNRIHHLKESAKLGIYLTQLALDHHFSRFSFSSVLKKDKGLSNLSLK